MARDSKRASTRVQVESSINSPNLVVAASPSAYPAPTGTHRAQLSPDMLLLSRALSEFAPTLAGMARDENIKKNKQDYIRGQAGRIEATEDDLQDVDKLLQAQTSDYVRGFMYAHGKSAASDLSAQMQLDWNAAKDQLVTPGQYMKWSSQYLQGAMTGVDDADFMQGFLESFSRTDEVLRQKTLENNYINQQADTASSLIKGYKGELAGVINGGGSLDDVHTSMQAWRDNGRILGLSNQEINESQFETLRELALETKDISLFDVFEKEQPDVDNPERMLPGLANSPKWQKRIFDAKVAVTRAIESDRAKKDEVAEYRTRNTINSLIADNRYEEARQMSDKAVSTGVLKGGEGSTFVKRIIDEEKKHREFVQYSDALRGGEYARAERLPGATSANKQKALTMQSDDRWQHAGDDPLQQQAALSIDMEISQAANFKYPKYEETLRAGPDSNKYGEAYALYQAMQVENPAVADTYLTENQARWFHVYGTMLRAGYNEEEARAVTLTYGTAENVEKANAVFRHDQRDHRDFIKDKLMSFDPGAFSWEMDAADEAKMVETVSAMMRAHFLSSGGNVTLEGARDYAIERFTRTHTAVKKPGTDTVTWLRNGVGRPPEDIVDAVQHMSDGLQTRFEGTRWEDPVGYYVDRTNQGDYVVYRASNDMPIPSGQGVLRFPSLDVIVNDYRETVAAAAEPPPEVDPEVVQSLHAERQLRRELSGKSRKFRRDMTAEQEQTWRVKMEEAAARTKRAEAEAARRNANKQLTKEETEERTRSNDAITKPIKKRKRNRNRNR